VYRGVNDKDHERHAGMLGHDRDRLVGCHAHREPVIAAQSSLPYVTLEHRDCQRIVSPWCGAAGHDRLSGSTATGMAPTLISQLRLDVLREG
jgi:hypothetical protein